MRRSDRVALICLGAGVVLILGAIQVIGMLDAPPRTPGDLCPSSPSGDVGDHRAKAAPYEGAGPHPIVAAGPAWQERWSGLPATWGPPREDASLVQLVACVYSHVTSTATKTCTYGLHDRPGKTIRLTQLATVYTVEVYQAGSAAKVASLRVPGASLCQYTQNVPTGKDGRPTATTVAQFLSAQDLVKALRPYVEGTANG
ncbi:hypothetical protein [Actinomadura sp. DC4]|uniref:hypothetical protein n=1 Tax=Actinomadura sp. DC4 TaxID=3055069 RepID=UPI0025B1FE34|nr:hypothetical protein [Actinomadura sp. DC4]MDN3358329.1 hypothetical protein [Actinomadura sp. DC4]